LAEGYVSRFGHQQLTTAERATLPTVFDGQVIFNITRRNTEVYDEADAVWLSDKQIKATNDSGVTLLEGQPVVRSGTSPNGVTLSSTESDEGIVGVVVDGDLSPGGVLTVATAGDWPVYVSGATTVGQLLAQSAVSGEASALASGGSQGAFAVVKEAVAGPGPALVQATLQPTNRTDQRPGFNPRSVAAITLTSSSGQPYIETTSTTYDVVAQYGWAGSDLVSPVQAIGAIVELGGGTDMSIRIFDVTNVATIAELTGITDVTFTFRDLGAVTNVSATPAVWEIQLLANGGGRKARCASVVFLPPTT
jgi:hypothetical protein